MSASRRQPPQEPDLPRIPVRRGPDDSGFFRVGGAPRTWPRESEPAAPRPAAFEEPVLMTDFLRDHASAYAEYGDHGDYGAYFRPEPTEEFTAFTEFALEAFSADEFPLEE